jgi:hypothetical protein
MRRDDDEALDTPPEPAAVDLAWWAREMFDSDLVAVEFEPDDETAGAAERVEQLGGACMLRHGEERSSDVEANV